MENNRDYIQEQEQLAFALDSTYVNKTSLVSEIKKYTRDQLQSFLQAPLKNRIKLQEISDDLFMGNGLYQKLILYYANLMTFDHFLYPVAGSNFKNLMKSMLSAAEYLDRLNIKSNYRMITEEWLKKGEVFYYELEDNTGIILKRIPNSICRINRNENGVLRYEVDCSKLDDRTIQENGFPEEFKQLADDYKAKKASESKLANNPSKESQWREVSNKGVAFSANLELSNTVPVFTTLFESLLAYSDRASRIDESIDAENLKIVHMKTPMDKTTGKLLMDFNLARTFHEAAKRNLPTGVAISTNPLDMEVFNLKNSSTSSQSDENLRGAVTRVLNEAGVNGALFNGDKVTAEILKQSIIADISVVSKLLGQLENWTNFKLSSNSKSKRFKMSIIQSTIFDKDTYLKNAKENLAFGGSRLYYFATAGLTPMQALSMLSFETENEIDVLLKPLQTSHTMSGKSEAGRNTAEENGEEVTDSGDKNRGDK